MSAALDLPQLPRRIVLSLADLARAGDLAGVPLPLALPSNRRGRATGEASPLGERLGAGPGSGPDDVRRALAAPDRLAELDLLVDGELVPEVALALTVLATGPLRMRLDLAVERDSGVVPLRSWFGVGHGLVAQLSTAGGRELELAWYSPDLWAPQLGRTLASAAPPGGSTTLPDVVSLPSEDLAAGCAAVRAGRPDLLSALLPDRAALVSTLESTCRGRLRVLVRCRERAAVTTWVLHDDGWRELRPGPGTTARLRRRDPRLIGSWLAAAVLRAAAAGAQ